MSRFISDLIDEANNEKANNENEKAIKEIIGFIADQDSIIDSTYKTYELLQSDIEYLKSKYLEKRIRN